MNDPARLLVQPVPSDNKIGRVADVVRRAHGSVKQCRKLHASEVVRPIDRRQRRQPEPVVAAFLAKDLRAA